MWWWWGSAWPWAGGDQRPAHPQFSSGRGWAGSNLLALLSNSLLLTIIVFGWSQTMRCSGLSPGSVLKYRSWWGSNLGQWQAQKHLLSVQLLSLSFISGTLVPLLSTHGGVHSNTRRGRHSFVPTDSASFYSPVPQLVSVPIDRSPGHLGPKHLRSPGAELILYLSAGICSEAG